MKSDASECRRVFGTCEPDGSLPSLISGRVLQRGGGGLCLLEASPSFDSTLMRLQTQTNRFRFIRRELSDYF
jgi:hypothetical protein